jgi:hypothetical protein
MMPEFQGTRFAKRYSQQPEVRRKARAVSDDRTCYNASPDIGAFNGKLPWWFAAGSHP